MSSDGPPTAPPGRSGTSVHLAALPVATMAARDGVFVEVNEAFAELTGWAPERVVGSTLLDVLHRLVSRRDHVLLERLVRSESPRKRGSIWCRLTTATGMECPVRVEWCLDEERREALVFLLDARPEEHGQRVTDALARVAGLLSSCATEEEVLNRAVDALCSHGFTASVLLIDDGDPLLRYGPSRGPNGTSAFDALDLPRTPREILTRLNPAFMDRRAAFFQDGYRIVREAYEEDVATRLRPYVSVPRMVQAPLFLANEPYGALVVTGDALTPIIAAALELFGELVGKALEAVRLRRELMDRERLAALGEAAGVMAHEVRNPVAAIMNALTLLGRKGRASADGKALLQIIAEETSRLEHLVSQLLELGRPLLPRPRAFSLAELTRRAARLLESRGELRTDCIEIVGGAEPPAWLDPDLTELCLVNVLRNALQSTDVNGRIRVRVVGSDASVEWVSEDDGPGIPASILERIGQPFVTTRATGTGMGFAVVRRIMEASDGAIEVGRSDDLGGARITLRFPRAPADAT